MIFFSSDHHFGDDRFDILQRPFHSVDEYIDCCVSRWNEKVNDGDTVFYIGDAAYGDNVLEYLAVFDRLNGEKILIPGNHDVLPVEEYKKYFSNVWEEDGVKLSVPTQDGDEWESYLLVHYPTKGTKEFWNICGHIHHSWKVQKNMINVGVDCWHFYPASIEDIRFLKNAVCNFYDDDVWIAYDEINLKYKNRGKKGSYTNK